VNPDTPEFALIDRHFTRAARRADVVLGVGDDGALLQPPAGSWLVLTTDTMVCGTHFLPTDDPEALGHKLVAVNLSDLAAMGADPAWLTLALTLPEIDHDWLAAFATGLFGLADAVGAELVGGDVTRGPLTLTLQAAGTVPMGMALRRDGARPGDGVYVSGTLGDAAMALALRLTGATVPAPWRRAWIAPARGWPWGAPCADRPVRRSTSRTGCWPIWATCARAAGWAPRLIFPGCPDRKRSWPPRAGSGMATSH